MGRKRKSGLTLQAKERDGYICQCCGRPGDEGHHIHPLVFDGPDEVNNIITLCSLCHKHSPNNPAEFLNYQREGGEFTRRFSQGWRSEYAADAIRQAAEKGKPIPTDQQIDQDFERTYQDIRCNVYGVVQSSALSAGVPELIAAFEARDRERNDEILMDDKAIAEHRQGYFSQLPESEYAWGKIQDAALYQINVKHLRERYGLTKAMHDEIERQHALKTEAMQFMLQKPDEGFTFSNCRGVDNWSAMVKLLRKYIDECLWNIKLLSPAIKEGNEDKLVEAYKEYKGHAISIDLDSERALIPAAEFMVQCSMLRKYRSELAKVQRIVTAAGHSLEHAGINFPGLENQPLELDKDHDAAISRKVWNWAKSRLGISDQANQEPQQLTLAI